MDYAVAFAPLATEVTEALTAIVPVGVGVGAAIIGVRFGWRFLKGMAR